MAFPTTLTGNLKPCTMQSGGPLRKKAKPGASSLYMPHDSDECTTAGDLEFSSCNEGVKADAAEIGQGVPQCIVQEACQVVHHDKRSHRSGDQGLLQAAVLLWPD